MIKITYVVLALVVVSEFMYIVDGDYVWFLFLLSLLIIELLLFPVLTVVMICEFIKHKREIIILEEERDRIKRNND